MKQSQELFNLIRSMDKNEKRYFKMQIQQNQRNGGSNYGLIFDSLNGLPVYDEEKVKRRIEDPKVVQNLPTLKYQLFKLLLRTLRHYHENQSIVSELRCSLEEIEILRQKNLKDSALRLIEKAKKRAVKFEQKVFVLQLCAIEREILESFSIISQRDSIRETLELENETSSNYHDWLELIHHRSKVIIAESYPNHLRPPEVEEELNRILNSRVVRYHNRHQSKVNRIIALQIKSYNARLNRSYEKMYEYLKSIIDTYNSDDELLRSDSLGYLQEYDKYISSFLFTARHAFLVDETEKLEAIEFHTPFERFESEIIVRFRKLMYYLNFTTIEESQEQMSDIANWLWNVKRTNFRRYIVMINNMMVYYFWWGKWKLAGRWANKLIITSISEQNQGLHSFGRIIQIILHIEAGNYDIITSLIRSAKRAMTKDRDLSKFEALIFKYFKAIERDPQSDQVKSALEELNLHTKEIFEDKKKKPFHGLVEMMFWSESKLEGKSLPDFFREKLEERKREVQQMQEKKLKRSKKRSKEAV